MNSFDAHQRPHAQAAKNLPMRGNVTSGMERIQNMPRCKVWSATGEAGHGPGAAFVPLSFGGWSNAEYDTDGMFTVASPYITCRTAGLYLVIVQYKFGPAPAAAENIWVRLMNPTNTRTYADQTTQGVNPTTFGVYFTTQGLWPANAGDQIGGYVFTTAATDIAGGIDTCYLQACMISTL